MKVLVLGKGSSGMAAAKLAEAQGRFVDFADGVGLVVASPGVRVMSELEFGCRELKRLGVKMLAVTGSKGKSSVVKLVADALNLAGMRATPCGNYGLPVSELALSLQSAPSTSTPIWAVVEVSSFMLETTTLPPDTFEAAAILNLQEDHLDRHGSVEIYHALKRRLLGFAKEGVAPGDARCDVSAVPCGCYFDNDVLRANGACSVALMRAAGLDDATIARAFREFEPLPHRFQLVAERGGVRYVDDSKATSVSALVAGVAMAGGGVRLIAGGLPKGDDPKIAVPILTDRAKKVYLIGQSAELFRSAWKDAVDCEVCGTMDRAVEAARRDAEKGDTVLLSPGTASFDQFKSFGERGEVFASLVKKEG
jgi:UDP-N-acetylmuramoylalanine--D-glutamate ligase